MTVYVVYKRSKGNQSDQMISYSTDRAVAEQLIPPDFAKEFYIQELPKLEIAKPTYSSGLWTRDDAKAFNEDNNYLKKSVVTQPMQHRTNYPTEIPGPVTNYIKGFEDSDRKSQEDVTLFDVDNELKPSVVTCNITKNKPGPTTNYKRYHEPKQKVTVKPLAPVASTPFHRINVNNNTSKPKLVTHCAPPPLYTYPKYEEDGVNVFRYSFRYCYPNMKPQVNKCIERGQEETDEVKFIKGDVFPDRDFILVAYSTSLKKAEVLVKKELKKLIDNGKIRP